MLQAGAEPLGYATARVRRWPCAVGVSRVVAIFGVRGWRWDWVPEVRGLVFALEPMTPGSSSDTSSPARPRGAAERVVPAGSGSAPAPPVADREDG